MSTPALALLVLSAALHATWNYLAKRTGAGVVLVPLVAAVSAVVYLPVALAVVAAGSWRPGGIALGFIAGTAVLHTGYFTALQRGYERSDLSLVYPLARGTGPLFATLGAVVSTVQE